MQLALNSSRRLAQRAFTINVRSRNNVGIQVSNWLKSMLEKAKRPLQDFQKFCTDEAKHNFIHGWVVKNSKGKPVVVTMRGSDINGSYKKKAPKRHGGADVLQVSLDASRRALEHNNISGIARGKRANNWRTTVVVPATITRCNGKRILKYTAFDGSVKQEILPEVEGAPLVERTVVDRQRTNVVRAHSLKMGRTPFHHTQNIGYHLSKIGYC